LEVQATVCTRTGSRLSKWPLPLLPRCMKIKNKFIECQYWIDTWPFTKKKQRFSVRKDVDGKI
jgi:hypothetical protein